MDATEQAIAAAGARLKQLRTRERLTLAQVAEQTGISTSTISRLESGGRRATLELLLPLARVYGVTLDELVEAPELDPRVRPRAIKAHGMTMLPLTRRSGGIQAYKIVIPQGLSTEPQPRSHEGYDWLYVLRGRLRVILGENDLLLDEGEVVEFDTRIPHWFGPVERQGVELLSLFSRQGETVHVRASSRSGSHRT